ncbi:unnamed protein product [Calypogeia fissa]
MECGQDGRGVHLYSHIHGHHHHSEKSSGAKTPKTPIMREAGIPNYNDIYASGRSSREKTPSARHASGEKTPNIYDRRLVPSSGRSSAEKTPREVEYHTPLREETHARKRSSHKRERSNERRRVYEDDEEDEKHMNNERQLIAYGSTRPIPSSNTQQDHARAPSTPSRRHRTSKSREFHSPERQRRIMYDEGNDGSEEDESACSTFRGQWNSTPPGVKTDIISSSQVSVVRSFVQAQAQALGKYNDSKENCNQDEWDLDLKKPKSTKNLTHQKAIAAVLAFQRWRHTQLKKLFSMELRSVLEEAKEDEACLAQLEKELATKDKHLAQLRAQVEQYERQSHEQINQKQMHELLGANVQELEKECQKALERASLAEDVIRKRDAENVRLRERLRSLDEEGVRLDSELQTNLKLLQNEKESALDEGRILLAQLTRRDEEVTQQCKEIEKLRATIAQISDRQTAQINQVDEMKADHHAQVQSLQDKLQQAYAAKHAKETELASYTERCNGLGQERQNLLVQLHRAVERADLASRRAEELQMKLHCTTEERAKASEDVASEMAEHLKRLTGHMKELETSVDQNGLICLPPGLQRKAGLAKISTKLAQAELDTLNLLSQAESCDDDQGSQVPFPEVEENRRQVCFSVDRKNRRRSERSSSAVTPFIKDGGDPCNMSVIDRDIALTKLKNWTAWKWRWAASAARADSLLKQLQNQQITQESKFYRESEGSIVQRGGGNPLRGQSMGLVKKLEASQFNTLNVIDGGKVGAFVLKHKLVPLMMSAWRAFARMSGLERRATSRNESLNKIISALPWWIRRVGERRLMERFFFHWQLLTLKATREKSNTNHRRKIIPFVSPVLHTRGRDREGDLSQAQQPQGFHQTHISRAPIPVPVRDAEVQTAAIPTSRGVETDGRLRTSTHGAAEEEKRHRSPIYRAIEVDGKHRTSTHGAVEMDGRQRTPTPGGSSLRSTSTPRFAQRAKSEPKTIAHCPTCEIRRKYSSRGPLNRLSTNYSHPHHEKADPKNGNVNSSTFTARALRALQGSLQQELRELQFLLSQEMEDMQQVVPFPAQIGDKGIQIPEDAGDHEDGGGGAEINRQALKSVFEVCNSLAQALMEVRSQLNCTENQGTTTPTRGSSPLPTPRVLRTRSLDARDTSEAPVGGRGRVSSSSMSREKFSLGRQNNSLDETRIPRYASPLGRDKAARFSSPGWRPQEKSPMSTREPWGRAAFPARAGQLREREARLHAPSTIRELREFRARQDRHQHAYENNNNDYSRSGRQTPQDREGEIEAISGREQQRQERQQVRRESVVRFSGDETKALERDHSEEQEQRQQAIMRTPRISSSKHLPPEPTPPPPPDYTTVVQILNTQNTKIGEVAIHTSAVATGSTTSPRAGGVVVGGAVGGAVGCAVERPSDRGGIADLCSSAKEAIRNEEQNKELLKDLEMQIQMQRQQQEQLHIQQHPRTPQQMVAAEESIYKAAQPNYTLYSRPKSALKLPASRGQSTPRERSRSHHVLRRPVDLNPRLDDTYFLSLRRKQCIGSDYADLLRSEIVRLREGRLMLEDCQTIGHGEEDGPMLQPRELMTPRSNFLANRPSWRPHYTAPAASHKK